MINVIVSYRVNPEFVEENKTNIGRFLDDFSEMGQGAFSYNVLLKEDGVTFVHISSYKDADIQNKILNTPSFLEFQKKRDESGLNNSHQVEVLQLIGASGKLY